MGGENRRPLVRFLKAYVRATRWLFDNKESADATCAIAYVVPFLFVFSPSLLLIGHWYEVTLSVVTAITVRSF